MGIEVIIIAAVIAIAGIFGLNTYLKNNKKEEPVETTPASELNSHKRKCINWQEGTWTEVIPDEEYTCTLVTKGNEFKIESIDSNTYPFWTKTDL